MIVLRACDLLVRGGETVTAGGAVPSAGELAVFCRPVVMAPAVVRRDGRMLAGGWRPDFVRLGGWRPEFGVNERAWFRFMVEATQWL